VSSDFVGSIILRSLFFLARWKRGPRDFSQFWISKLMANSASGSSNHTQQQPFSAIINFHIDSWGDDEVATLRAELEEEYSDLFGEQFFSSSSPTTPLAMEMATVLEIPEFHGGPEEDLSVWVETVSAIFEIAPKEDDVRYKYAVAYLRGGAPETTKERCFALPWKHVPRDVEKYYFSQLERCCSSPFCWCKIFMLQKGVAREMLQNSWRKDLQKRCSQL